jgi:hypothetical protein
MKRTARKPSTTAVPITTPPAPLTVRTDKLEHSGWVTAGAVADRGGVSIELTRHLGPDARGEQDPSNPSVTIHAVFIGVRDFDASDTAHGNGVYLTTEANAVEAFAKCLIDVVALAREGGVLPGGPQS